MSIPKVIPVILPTDSNLKSFNFYIVENDTKFFLVDAGIDRDECWTLFQEKLSEIGITVEDLDAIILTHHHFDHVGLVNRIRNVYHVPVYAHPKAFPRLKRDQAFLQQRIERFEKLYKKMGCQQEANKEIARLSKAMIKNESQTLKGEFLPVVEGDELFGFSIIELPGHSVDQIVLYHRESGILFSSDVVIKHLSSNALIDFDEHGNRTFALQQYEESLRRLLYMQIQKVYPGHGEIFTEPKQVIEKILNRLEEKEEEIFNSVEGRETAAKIAKKVYDDKYEKLFPLVMSKVIGHLDHLVSLNRLRMIDDGNVIYYEKVK